MKFIIKHLALLMVVCCAFSSWGQTLTTFQNKDKYGYVDENGNVVIKAQYSHAYPFENGRAKVSKGDKWGYIDTKGKAVIAIQYDNIEPFENGLARVKKGDKYGYIKDDGSFYIKPEYNFIGSFNDDGYIWVAKGKTLETAKIGLFRGDKIILKPNYQSLGFYVKTDSIDYTAGDPVTANSGIPQNNEIKANFVRLSVSDQPYIWAVSGFKTGVYDLEGLPVIKHVMGAVGMPREGFSLVRVYGKKKKDMFYEYNYVSTDKKNTQLFKKNLRQYITPETELDVCSAFNNGYARCAADGKTYIIDKIGRTVSPVYDHFTVVPEHGYITSKGGRLGLLKFSGEEILAPTYSKLNVADASGEVLAAQDPSSSMYGFIDFTGKQIAPFKYADAIAFVDNNIYVKEGLYYGIADLNGNYVVKNQWESIKPANTGDYVWAKSPQTGKWYTVNIKTDKLAFDQGYEDAVPYDAKGRALVKNNAKVGAVKTDNSCVLPCSFDTEALAVKALSFIDSNNKDSMSDIEAYRFNIYMNPDINKFRLHQAIPSTMWDF